MKNRYEIMQEARDLKESFPDNLMIADAVALLHEIAGVDEDDMMSEAATLDYLHEIEKERPEAVALVRGFLIPTTRQKSLHEILDSIDQMMERLAERHPYLRDAIARGKAQGALLADSGEPPVYHPHTTVYRDGYWWELELRDIG